MEELPSPLMATKTVVAGGGDAADRIEKASHSADGNGDAAGASD